jgi:hypothetical protein
MQRTDTCNDCVVTWLCRDEDNSFGSLAASNEEVTFAADELDSLRVFQDLGLAPALRHVRRHPSHASLVAS